MFCSKCGKQNADTSAFCAGCGAPLKNVQQPVQAVQPVQPVRVAQPVQPMRPVTPVVKTNNKKAVSKKKIIIISVLSVLLVVALAVSGFFIYNSAATSKFKKAVANKDISEMYSLYEDADDSKREKYNTIVSNTINEISQDLNNHSFDGEYDENGDAVMVYLTSKWGSLVPETLSEEAWEEEGLAKFTTAPKTDNSNSKVEISGSLAGTREFSYSMWTDLYDLAKSKANYCKAMYAYNVAKDYDAAIEYFSLVIIEDTTYNTSVDMSTTCVSVIFDEALQKANADFNSGNTENALNTLKEVQESLSQYGDSQERSDAIDAAIASYAESYMKKAEEYLKAGDVEAAIGHVEAAIAINPNGGYEDKLEEYKKYLPYPLYIKDNTLNCEKDEEFCGVLYFDSNMKSNDNREMEHSIRWYNKNNVKSASERAIYNLEGKYDTVSGTIFLSQADKDSTMSGYIEVYGDGKLLYTSPEISAGVLPQDFEVNVTGIQKLQISFHGQGTGGLVSSGPSFGVSNLIAQKNFPK